MRHSNPAISTSTATGKTRASHPEARLRGRARILFSADIARWVQEKQPDTVLLADGSLAGDIPWFTEDWIIDEVLRYCGEAVLMAPADTSGKGSGSRGPARRGIPLRRAKSR